MLSRANSALQEATRSLPALLMPAPPEDAPKVTPFPPLGERHPWPTLIHRSRLRELGGLAVRFGQLVARAPRQLVSRDEEGLAAFYGKGAAQAGACRMVASYDHSDCIISRSDFFLNRAGQFKLLEVNGTANVGALDNADDVSSVMASTAMQRTFRRLGIPVLYTDTIDALLLHYQRILEAGGFGPNLFIVISPVNETQAMMLPILNAYIQARSDQVCARRGSAFRPRPIFVPIDDIEVENDFSISANGVKADGVTEVGGPCIHEFAESFARGHIAVINGPGRGIFNDKRNIALLSEAASDGRLSPIDAKVVVNHVPWTRVLRDERTVLPDGTRGATLEYVRLHKDDLVIKSSIEYGGVNMHVGNETDQRTWESVIDSAANSDAPPVVQAFIDAYTDLYPDKNGDLVSHRIVLGPYAFGVWYGGAVVRVAPADRSSIINVKQGARRGALLVEDVFEPPLRRSAG